MNIAGHAMDTSSRRLSDHYSPWSVTSRSKVTSPTQPPRLINSWRPENPSSGPRAETMRATSPTTGRKRPCEFNDNEHGHRARRQRNDVWVAQDHDRDPADSYRLHWARRLDSEPDESRAPYRAPASPPDRIRSYHSDAPMATYDNRTLPLPEEFTPPPVTRWEQFYRRSENEDTYPRYPPYVPGHNAMTDQYPTDDVRVGQTYESMMGERMDSQPDPSLLARMRNTQRLPVIVCATLLEDLC
ncbi:hypothetical protein J3R83DRAFT_3650 [Lanmaoa asiatica]|nr:hypothetical protein J3R83DRAFT_3650 [Lanmaoa asiatica]